MKINAKIAFIITLFLLLAKSYTLFSQVIVSGKNLSYANDTISIYTYDDLICKQNEKIANLIFDKQGNFKAEIPLSETKLLFFYSGIYKFEFYAEPNQIYEISIPNKKEKSTADKLNPYFKHKIVLPGIKNANPNDINTLIREFDKFYDSYLEINFNKIVNGIDNHLDSFIIGLKKHFRIADNKYFRDYFNYKIYYLDFLAYHKDYKYITQYYYKNQEILYNNTAYMELFNNLYHNFFFLYPNTKNGKALYNDIARAKSPYAIKQTLSKEVVFSDFKIDNLIILKALHDAFVADVPFNYKKYPFSSLIITLDSMKFYANNDNEFKIIEDMKNKFVKKSMVKYKQMPDALVLDRDSNLFHLSDIAAKGKYTYISFTMTNCVPCIKDLEILKKYSEKYNHDLDIVTVIVNQDFLTMKEFLDKHKDYKWQFYNYNRNKKIFSTFNIEALPKYILLDPYGRVVQTSSPPPGERFVVSFRKIRQNSR